MLNGYTVTLGEHQSYMAEHGVRVKIYPKSKTFKLRVRKR